MASYKRLWEDSKTEVSRLRNLCEKYYDEIRNLNKEIRGLEERYEKHAGEHFLLAKKYIDLKNKMINVAEGGCEECDKKEAEIHVYKKDVEMSTWKDSKIREYGSLIYEKEQHIKTLVEQKEILKKRYKKIRRIKLIPYIVCIVICILTISKW